jgi:addiction module HigA family antidote
MLMKPPLCCAWRQALQLAHDPKLQAQRRLTFQLGVDRTTLSKVPNGRAAISPSMALRIERWLGRDHGGAAEVWLAQQAAYELWQARVAAKAGKTLAGIKVLGLQTS